jgi:hypothetical protein
MNILVHSICPELSEFSPLSVLASTFGMQLVILHHFIMMLPYFMHLHFGNEVLVLVFFINTYVDEMF